MPGYLANLVKRGAQMLPATRRRAFGSTIAVALPRAGREVEKVSNEVGGTTGSIPAHASEAGSKAPLPVRGTEGAGGEVSGVRKSTAVHGTGALNGAVKPETNQTENPGGDRAEARTRGAKEHRHQDTLAATLAKTGQAEAPIPGHQGEAARPYRGPQREKENSGDKFLKRPPKIEVETRRDTSGARSEVPQISAPMSFNRVSCVTAERPAGREVLRAKQNTTERVPPERPSSAQWPIAKDKSMTPKVDKPQVPPPIAKAPANTQPAMEQPSQARRQAVPVARKSESTSTSLGGLLRLGPSAERQQEGPRLSIGRLEIQIIQGRSEGVGAVQNSARESSGDAWERMDREHIRQLGGL
jgi:hypothetical protein